MLDSRIAGFRGITSACRQLCIALLLSVPLMLSASPPTAEYKLKAALIYKLTKFIEWPNKKTGKTAESFGVCLLGEDYFGNALDVLEDREVKGLPISVHRYSQSDAIDERCQIVFISDSKQAFMQPILQSLHSRPILTLGDVDNFAQQGGILQFTRGEKHIGFKINLGSAKSSQLTIAAPLLDLATIIDSAAQ